MQSSLQQPQPSRTDGALAFVILQAVAETRVAQPEHIDSHRHTQTHNQTRLEGTSLLSSALLAVEG